MTEAVRSDLLAAAQSGDRHAFDRLFGVHVPKLRGVLRRIVGHPDDVDDLAQQALLKAYEGLTAFRGDASAGTWLCSIGTRLAIDHLRDRKRWRERAQVMFAVACLESEEVGTAVGAAMSDPDFSYDANEHIAYCFTCVGRTLDPEAQAALVLREVLGASNDEAAETLGITRSVLRHRVAEARQAMQQTYEGLCALVNKQGVCWQCSGLRAAVPKHRRGPEAPTTVNWKRRLQIVRDADLDHGPTQPLHDVFFRHTETQEQTRQGNESTTTTCGHPSK